jgi:hypothetical protein
VAGLLRDPMTKDDIQLLKDTLAALECHSQVFWDNSSDLIKMNMQLGPKFGNMFGQMKATVAIVTNVLQRHLKDYDELTGNLSSEAFIHDD